jgi:hypothetical protein
MLLLVDAKIFALLSKTKIFRFLLQVDENGPHCHTSDPTKQQPTIVQQSNGSGGIRQLFPPEWLRVVSDETPTSDMELPHELHQLPDAGVYQ